MRAVADAHARAVKAAGDERPIGQLRGAVAARAGDPHGAGAAGGERACRGRRAAGHPGVRGGGCAGLGRAPVLVDGEPVTAALARELLERLDALCPGGLQAPPTAP